MTLLYLVFENERILYATIQRTPGSGKTTLILYANSIEDGRFIDADEIEGMCEWRELEIGKVLGLVTEYKEAGKDDWYAKYGWYWKTDRLKSFLLDNPLGYIMWLG